MTRLGKVDPSRYALEAESLERVRSPALVIFLDRVRDNLDRLIAMCGRDRLRPHIKSAKLPLVFREMVKRGLHHVKCATTREAQHMLESFEAEGVAGDLLVAYPHVGPSLAWLGALAETHPRAQLSVLSEDPEHVEQIPTSLGVFVDINVGMNRTGIAAADSDRIAAVARAAGPRFRGVHSYEGHVSSGTVDKRRVQAVSAYERVMEVLRKLADGGIGVGELVTSGTPSFSFALEYEPFAALAGTKHRVSPGTIVYFDARSEQCEELDFSPAAFVLSRVVSHPEKGIVTVDAGSKALAAEAGDPCALVLGHPELVAKRPSEEHLPLSTSGAPPPRGTPLLLYPRHVCPTVNLAEEAMIVEAGKVTQIAQVSARAH